MLVPHVLASVHFGLESGSHNGTKGLEARIPNRPLLPDVAKDVWPAFGPVSPVEFEGGIAAEDGRSIFVSLESRAGSGAGIEAVAFDAYRRLLRGVAAAGYPHFARMWNYVPRIHDKESGIDRYMCFCKGRSDAFSEHFGEAFAGRLPAASAVGCPGDTLVVHALASRDAVRHVENPRQISAYRYPERYGPKSPTFARGTVASCASGGTLFVSGTASIVGHESAFPGDPARQTGETMRNIEAVLDAAGVPGGDMDLGRRLRSLRVYVRDPQHLEIIRDAIRGSAGTAVPTAWLQAEICREELLVEIEATAARSDPK